jgi:hypothetical protein
MSRFADMFSSRFSCIFFQHFIQVVTVNSESLFAKSFAVRSAHLLFRGSYRELPFQQFDEQGRNPGRSIMAGSCKWLMVQAFDHNGSVSITKLLYQVVFI